MEDYYYNLQSRPLPLPPHRTQLHPRMLLPTPPPKPPNHNRSRPRLPLLLLLLLGLLSLPLLLYLLLASSRRLSSPLPLSHKSYSLLISASHRSSSLHVFELLNEGSPTPFLGEGARASPGIAALAARPGAAARQLMGLLERARRAVPRSEWGRTQVRLLESGGLGGLATADGRRVMEECRRALRSSGFAFRDEWARSISGEEKGVYTWVAANYLLGTFGGDPRKTMGVVEFDRASAQVTFSSSKTPPREFSYTLKLPRLTYNLYTRSIHQFEQEAAWDFLERIHNGKAIPPFSSSLGSVEGTIMNGCIPKGYSQTYNLQILSNSSYLNGSADSWGNFSECRFQALKLLRKGKDICSRQACKMLSELLINLHGENDNAENFLYISELFGLYPRASLADLEASAKHYCEGDWIELQKEHFHADEADLLKYCYSSSYLVAFLHDHLGIPMERQSIGLTNHSASAPLDWTLGAFILHIMVKPGQEHDNLNHETGDDLFTYIVLFTIFILLLLVIFFVWRWQKPQLKMIYDLGQGHYIVTRHS